MRMKAAAAANGAQVLGSAVLAVFVCWGIWAVFDSAPLGSNFQSRPSFKKTGDPEIDAANAVNARNCYGGSTRRCDPLDPTFYDDPTLSFSIESKLTDWDRKRKQWLKYHPSYAVGLEERVLVVTGSQPSECSHPSGDHLMLRLFKNKVDYCRRHGYEIFYNMAVLNPKMSGFWSKIQTIRSAMMAHPESEWIFWIDSDAMFTDMDFKLPLHRYRNHNLVVHGWENMIYKKKSWVSINAGVFLIRNCQWAVDFLDKWAEMGPQTAQYEKWGRIQTATFKDKTFPAADDQSAMVYMLLKQRRVWGVKTYIENEYSLHGYWVGIVWRLDNFTKKYDMAEARWRSLRRRHAEVAAEHYEELWDPQLGNDRRPFVTHFTGCQHCSGNHNPDYKENACWDGMKMALNFADNQVLRNFGFVHKSLMDNAVEPAPTRFFNGDDSDDDS